MRRRWREREREVSSWQHLAVHFVLAVLASTRTIHIETGVGRQQLGLAQSVVKVVDGDKRTGESGEHLCLLPRSAMCHVWSAGDCCLNALFERSRQAGSHSGICSYLFHHAREMKLPWECLNVKNSWIHVYSLHSCSTHFFPVCHPVSRCLSAFVCPAGSYSWLSCLTSAWWISEHSLS